MADDMRNENPQQPLDPLRLPLQGSRLIEASAGTGKTFTLAALYLRLLLGLKSGDSGAMSQSASAAAPLPGGAFNVTQLLVVTFTEAATQELRGRIRASIHAMRLACLRGYSDNPLCQCLLAELACPAEAAEHLLLAERQMDEAAIFTIHGFCQRMLMQHAFESGMPFVQNIIENEASLRHLACADFWRRCCYPLSADIAGQISQLYAGPQALLQALKGFLTPRPPRVLPEPLEGESLHSRHQRLTEMINQLKSQWQAYSAGIASLISQSDINKNHYKSHHLAGWIGKIDAWASQPADDYQLPDALARFRQSVLREKSKGAKVPTLALFSEIDQLYEQFLSLHDVLIRQALRGIADSLADQKRRRGELGFDDMLTRLDSALGSERGAALAQAIVRQFPVAMVDEFQDTDPLQYRIFQRVWHQQSGGVLLLIGDPKQAIYAFRGADVFTYMQARHEVNARYTLDINWRSSPAMIASVNHLFSQLANPFLYQDIPFIPVKPAAGNQKMRFSLNGETQPAMQFCLPDTAMVSGADYRQTMAKHYAGQIRDWLQAGLSGAARLERGDGERSVQAADITVLVRHHREATLMREALAALAIPSVYLSNRDSVFCTVQARELVWLLRATLAPEREADLRRAVSVSLLGLNSADIEALNHDEAAWDQLVERFITYRRVWWQSGVMPMLHLLMRQYQIAENLLATPGGERALTDVLHIGELLQEAASQIDSPHGLVRWLERQINEPGEDIRSQQMRLESDRHLVQIVTIHKAKGLEYPIVCLPFIADLRQAKQAVYHDEHSGERVWDLRGGEAALQRAEHERLAEDMRLLYVALTRAIWHCSIGLAPLRGRANSPHSLLHHSALGNLMQRGEARDDAGLRQCLTVLCAASNGSMAWRVADCDQQTRWQPPIVAVRQLAARRVLHPLTDNWCITSYSGLQQHSASLWPELELPQFDVEAIGDGQSVSDEQQAAVAAGSVAVSAGQLPVIAPVQARLSIHQFPRGAGPGTFLHSLLECIDFSQPIADDWLDEQLRLAGFDPCWQPVLSQWLRDLLALPLAVPGLTLQQLNAGDKISELAFWLPISRDLSASALDTLTRRYDPLSAACPPLEFRTVRGMLKGFIDLVFRWQGRYYLLDYKSNWLGDSSDAYHQQAMRQAMMQHRYDLQYQLYSLALHRYLRHRLAGYHYQQHFGGVIYLFLRGATRRGDTGVYHTCLPMDCIDGLDALFSPAQAETDAVPGGPTIIL